MKFNFFKSISIIISVIFTSSCLTTQDPAALSSDASVTSLTFSKMDSIHYLETASFSLVDNLIVNLDSLPYKTRIDSVYPNFKFASTGAAFLVNIAKNDSIQLTGKDTVDFTNNYRLRNYAADLVAYKDYFIKVNVHQVEPELYNWRKLTESLASANNQKMIARNDSLHYFTNDGTTTLLTSSVNGSSWTSPIIVSGLPASVAFSDIIINGGKFFLTQNNEKIYSSYNGIIWTSNSLVNYTFKSLLFSLNDSLHAILQSKIDDKIRFSSSKNGLTWITKSTDVIPTNFPTSDFTALSFKSRSGKPKAIVIGGMSATNVVLKTNWSTEDGSYWLDFSRLNHSLDTLALGSALISYDSKLLLFGKKVDGSNHYKVSVDEGLTWQIPSKTLNYIPVDYQTLIEKSAAVIDDKTNPVVTDKANRIFIIGKKTSGSTVSDVWTGKLNRKGFTRQ